LCIQITKLFNNEGDQNFYSFGRVISGTLKAGQLCKVLGENYSLAEEEDMTVKKATKLWIL
jgi:U5 small nuclear ribonucleoprotein component